MTAVVLAVLVAVYNGHVFWTMSLHYDDDDDAWTCDADDDNYFMMHVFEYLKLVLLATGRRTVQPSSTGAVAFVASSWYRRDVLVDTPDTRDIIAASSSDTPGLLVTC